MNAARPPDLLDAYASVSFDVFDTLVTRVVADPRDAFDLLASRFRLGKAFRVTRERSERAARVAARRGGREEVTLAEIYREVGARMGWDAEREGQVAQGEIDLEVSLCVPNPYGRDLYEAARAGGKRVVAISDMYLPTPAVEAILDRCGYGGVELFVSAELGTTKHAGGMYDLVRARLGDDAAAWLHIGDNRHSDGEVARARGIRTHLVPGSSCGPVGSAVRGVYLKGAEILSASEATDDETRFWRRAARTVAAPLIVGLCLAARRRAEETGSDRIYFLARDGRIALEAYRELFPDDGRNLVYLYASRRAINFAGIDAIDERALRFLKDGKKTMSIRGLLRRLGLGGAAEEEAAARGLDLDSIDPPTFDLERFFEAIGDQVLAAAAREREILVDYLRESGLAGDGHAVVVDVGWNFSIQRSLAKIAAREGWGGDLHGVYLGTKPAAHRADAGSHDAIGWLCQGGRPRRDRDRLERSIEFVELMFAAPEHGIQSIERTPDGFGPKRFEVAMENGRIAIARIMRGPILGMARMIRESGLLDVIGDEEGREAALLSLDGVLANPNRETASIAGAVRHSLGFGDSSYAPLVSPVGNWRSPGQWVEAFRRSYWREGLAALAPRPLDRLARIVLRIAMPLYRGVWRLRYERKA